jgi:hypothetical protein
MPLWLLGFWGKWGRKLMVGAAILAVLAGLVFAVHQIGYQKGHNESKVAIAKYEAGVQKLRADLAVERGKVDTKVVTEYLTKRETETVVEYRNRDVIRNAVVSRPENLSKGWVYAHNQATKGQIVEFDLAKIGTPSIVRDVDALDIIQQNYAIARRNKAKLDGLQSWVRETGKAYEQVNRNRTSGSDSSVQQPRKTSRP